MFLQPIIIPDISEGPPPMSGPVKGMGKKITEAFADRKYIIALVIWRVFVFAVMAVILHIYIYEYLGTAVSSKVLHWLYVIAGSYIFYSFLPLYHFNDHIVFCENGYYFNDEEYNMSILGRMYLIDESTNRTPKRATLNVGRSKTIAIRYMRYARKQHYRAYNVEDNFLYSIKCINEINKGIDSRDKKKIMEIVQRMVPDDAVYTPLYAYWFETSPNKDTVQHYAIGYCEERLFVIPISYRRRKMVPSEPFVIEKKELYMIETLRNCGPINLIRFYDKELKEVLSIWVERNNMKLDKYTPFNISQRKESPPFIEMICRWKEEVN